MKRFSALAIAFALSLVMGAAPAFAAPAFTITVHFDESFVNDLNSPCVPAEGSSVVIGVDHFTSNGNGSHFTRTEVGDLAGEGLSGEVVLGSFTFWVGGNFKESTGILKGILTLTGSGTVDGEPFMFNIRDKFQDNGDTVSGTVWYNCHDGQGPQSLDYGPFPSP